MDDAHGHCGEWTFSIEELAKLSRAGTLPHGYLDALHARQQAVSRRLQSEIAAAFAAAANDPALLARLNRTLP